MNELYIIRTREKEVNRGNLLNKMGDTKRNRMFELQKFKTIRSLGIDIWKGNTTLKEALEDQITRKSITDDICCSTRPRKTKTNHLIFIVQLNFFKDNGL